MDIDEEAFREDRVSAHLYGYMKVPFARGLVQSAKAGGVAGEQSALHDVAMDVIQHMAPGELQILGPGTTTRTILDRLELPTTLLGVDAVARRRARRRRRDRGRPARAPRASRAGAHHRHRHRRPGAHLRARQPADQPGRHPPRRPRAHPRHRHADQAALARGSPAARRHRRPGARRRALRLRQGHDRPRRADHVQGRGLTDRPSGRPPERPGAAGGRRAHPPSCPFTFLNLSGDPGCHIAFRCPRPAANSLHVRGFVRRGGGRRSRPAAPARASAIRVVVAKLTRR